MTLACKEKKMVKKLLKKCAVLLMLALIAGMTLGCNTMQGVGEDVQEAGGAIEDAAE
jgi:predicted small secreted protein